MAKRGGGFQGMPGNMQNIMKQAQRLQRQMEEAQKELETMEFEGTSGGGVVKITVTGQKQVTKVELQPEAVDPDDIEMLQDLILTATNEALKKVDEYSEQKLGGGMGGSLGGMKLPGMF
ncbi:MAG: YbaB/EbfC family nucleoid-associated protein [Firmicutes bacterium]|nr:YbaB/EbfC family nucleoid-associated protein [Bacillota bacterium]MBR3393377.1 YbaB/EbfC family nucleoid-associated protein [Bacillota bacterium]